MPISWILPLLFAGCLMGAAALDAGNAPAAPRVSLRVMTYNIHYGDPDLARIAEVICASGADVVGLQEVDVHWGERSGFADQAAGLAAACAMDFRFGPIYSLPSLPGPEPGRPARQFGVAILSRRPILSWKNHLLTRLSTQAAAGPESLPGFLQVTVDVEGEPLHVFVTHLDFRPDPSVRRTQVAEMLAVLGEGDGPTVLLGDLNATPDREELAPLFSSMRDAWAPGTGDGFTFPGEAPVRRIDYIFLSGPLSVASVHVPETDASDHRPVIADITLRRP